MVVRVCNRSSADVEDSGGRASSVSLSGNGIGAFDEASISFDGSYCVVLPVCCCGTAQQQSTMCCMWGHRLVGSDF